MNALRTTEDAASLLLVPTYLAASVVPVILATPATDLPAHVRSFAAIFHSGMIFKRLDTQNSQNSRFVSVHFNFWIFYRASA